MQWPIEIYNILEQYYLYSKMAPAESTNNRRRNLVRRLKTAYDELPFAQKVDVLVPADYHFLTEDAVKSDPISGLVNGFLSGISGQITMDLMAQKPFQALHKTKSMIVLVAKKGPFSHLC